MEIVYKKVNDLIPYINNSRTHSEEQVNQIVASINEFGFTRKGSFAEISCTIKINLPYALKCFPHRPINKIIEEIINCSLDELGR